MRQFRLHCHERDFDTKKKRNVYIEEKLEFGIGNTTKTVK